VTRHLPFREIWLVDFEFWAPPGERPNPICLVAHESRSRRRVRLWRDELLKSDAPPYDVSGDSLFIAYFASAEFGCHLVLDWPLPENVLDLYVEFRNLTNGFSLPCGNDLLGALASFGLPSIDAGQKQLMRELAMRGGPYTPTERLQLLDYCESDVAGMEALLTPMLPKLDLPRALLRGRCMKAVSWIEHIGVPIDHEKFSQLDSYWHEIQRELIWQIDSDFNVYDDRTFKVDRFLKFLTERNITWPRLESGALDLEADTFREMARIHPELNSLKELRATLGQMRLSDLAIGGDNRNRTLLSPFRATSGRNIPSSSKFVFGPAVWFRSLIRPEQGTGLAYVDWEQQEFGIGAALSQDGNMMTAYRSGDPYLAFARLAGAVPDSATRDSHRSVRELFKTCALGVQYGMGAASLAARIGQAPCFARELLRLHRETFSKFWRWSDAAVDHAMLHGHLQTVFGWKVHAGPEANPRSLRNFPLQANGAEMLRLACCYLTEAGVWVAAPVHDAILVEAPLPEFEETIYLSQSLMAKASVDVLGGFELKTDVRVVRYPERFYDPRGSAMWRKVEAILTKLEGKTGAKPVAPAPRYEPGGCALAQQPCCSGAHPLISYIVL
jgi:DNA polymerase-1